MVTDLLLVLYHWLLRFIVRRKQGPFGLHLLLLLQITMIGNVRYYLRTIQDPFSFWVVCHLGYFAFKFLEI